VLGKYGLWLRYQSLFVRWPPEHDVGSEAVPDIEAMSGRWGLIPGFTRRTRWLELRSYRPSMPETTASPTLSTPATPGAGLSTASSRPMPSSNPTGDPAKRLPPGSPGRTARRWASPSCGIATGPRPASVTRATQCSPSMSTRFPCAAITPSPTKKTHDGDSVIPSILSDWQK